MAEAKQPPRSSRIRQSSRSRIRQSSMLNVANQLSRRSDEVKDFVQSAPNLQFQNLTKLQRVLGDECPDPVPVESAPILGDQLIEAARHQTAASVTGPLSVSPEPRRRFEAAGLAI